MRKRVLSLVMALCMLLTLLPVTASAAGILGGSLGGDVYYSFDSNSGVMTIYGTGPMPDYTDSLTFAAYDYIGINNGFWFSKAPLISTGNIKKVVIKDGVTSISRGAFYDLRNLESVEFPDSIIEIGPYAFYDCALKTLELPDNLTTIGCDAFYSNSFTEIVVPKGVTTVETKVFNGCRALTSVTFEGPITDIGASAFYNCPNLTSVTFKEGVYGVIGREAFSFCEKLVDCVLTEGVIGIGSDAFWGCESLPNMIIPESVQYIDASAFSECRAFTAITIPQNVIYVGTNAFIFCDNVKEVTIHSGTNIGSINSLPPCRQLDYVHIIGDAPVNWPKDVFGQPTEGFVVYYDRGTSGWEPYTWGNYVIEVWGEPESVKTGTCGENATWTLENGVMTISGTGPIDGYGQGTSPWYAFKHKVKKLVIEDGITEIGDGSFYSLHRMTEVSIPDSVTSLGYDCFGLCQSLTELTIPASVTQIGHSFIEDELYIESVYFQGDAPDIYGSAFSRATVTAYYPAGNETWTEDVLKDYSGTVTWVPYCPGHVYEAVTTEASCIQDGFTTYTCTYCQDTYTGDYVYATGQHTYTDDTDTDCDICGNIRDLAMPTTPMYRMYNPNSGEHFYTGSLEERENLIAAGWAYEGIAWNAPISSGEPVYRLFNPNSGDHHYTMSADERDMLAGLGWQYEGVCWNSATPDNLPLYRLYNPNADCGSHHYTGSTDERDMLVGVGWIFEGIGWFGMLN